MGSPSYTVGQLARMAGITVRTLHHYDRIGLLRAPERTEGGYRRYEAADVERLHRILSYRELGIPLDQIATLLDDRAADPLTHLDRQERLLRDRMGRLEEMLAAIQTMKEAHEMDLKLTPEERFELFGDFDPAAHAKEAQDRWGDTDAYRQSRKRTRSYAKEEWRRIQEEGRTIEADFARALRHGADPSSAPVIGIAEAHRRHIERWFYDCPLEVHRGLGEMYVADARFTAHYEQQAEGLAEYVRDAIVANAQKG